MQSSEVITMKRVEIKGKLRKGESRTCSYQVPSGSEIRLTDHLTARMTQYTHMKIQWKGLGRGIWINHRKPEITCIPYLLFT